MSEANDYQVAGKHYRKNKIQHWDYVAANDLDYFQGQITKYVGRWKDKNGLEDLEKARHVLEKYIEIEKAKIRPMAIPLPVMDRAMPPATKFVGGLVQNPFGYDPEEELDGKPPQLR